MHDIMHKDIALRTEVVLTFWTPVASQRAHTLTGSPEHGRGRIPEGHGAPMTSLAGIWGLFERHPATRNEGEYM